ncbi:MAG: signal peptidase I [Longimicrobiales bacterium]
MAVEPGSSGSVEDRGIADNTMVAAGAGGPPQTTNDVRDWVRSLVLAVALFLFVRAFFIEAFRIPTGSMQETLLAGDFVLVNKAVYGARIPFTPLRLPAFQRPERGDVVVFAPPHDVHRNYVKRLVGSPGDTIAMHDKVLFVNGHAIDEPYARHSDPHDIVPPGGFWQCRFAVSWTPDSDCHASRDNWGPLVVPADAFLVLGDNRDDSEDSRYWGFVPRDAIRGRPIFVYYSFEPDADRSIPWLSSVRWNRIGRAVQ